MPCQTFVQICPCHAMFFLEQDRLQTRQNAHLHFVSSFGQIRQPFSSITWSSKFGTYRIFTFAQCYLAQFKQAAYWNIRNINFLVSSTCCVLYFAEMGIPVSCQVSVSLAETPFLCHFIFLLKSTNEITNMMLTSDLSCDQASGFLWWQTLHLLSHTKETYLQAL